MIHTTTIQFSQLICRPGYKIFLAKIPVQYAKASASSIECVVSTTAAFCLAAAKDFHMLHIANASMPLEGSSRRITDGFPISATTKESLHLFPPESL